MNFSRSIAVCILLCLSIHFMVCLAEQPLEISLVTKTVSSGKKDGGFVKVRVTDAAGNFASKAKVVLLKAYPTEKEDTVLATKQEFTAVDGDNTAYQINFLALKPETGSYTLELQATPTDKKFSTVDASVNVRVTGTATVFDTQITVSDNDDGTDGKKYKVESDKKLNEVKVGENQHVFVEFKVKGASGKNIEVHQAFVKISQPKTGREVIKVAEPSAAKGYQTQFSVKDLAYEFYGQSGAYDLQLIVGDFSIQNPIELKLATVQFTFPNSSQTEVPRSPFEVQPDIAHRFRKPDPRPPKSISMAFTGIALGIPFLVLFIGLVGVGANLSNFPGGSNFIWAIGFQASLGAILSLFGLYWLRLNMMQTLGYFTILAGPALFFAHKNLNGLSQVKQHKD